MDKMIAYSCMFQTHPLDANKRPTIMPVQIDYNAPVVVETDVTVTEFME